MYIGQLARVSRLVRDFNQRVVVLRGDAADGLELRVEIQWRVASAGQCDDLDVEPMRRRKIEQSRQRFASILGREIHPSAPHRQHANDSEMLAFGPGEQTLDLLFFAAGDVFEQSESGDAAPLNGMAIRRREACASNSNVALHAS